MHPRDTLHSSKRSRPGSRNQPGTAEETRRTPVHATLRRLAWLGSPRMYLSLTLALTLASAGGALAQVCSTTPLLQVGVLNTTATVDAPYVSERTAAMAAALPETAAEQELDVLCLTELRSPEFRNTALQGFLNDSAWNVYQPEPADQPGCANACVTDPFTAFRFTLGLNRWVQFCAYRTIPGTDFSCIASTSESSFRSCLVQFCPFLLPELQNANSPNCEYCLEQALPGESFSARVLRCSSTYASAEAAACAYRHDGEVGATLISRYPFVATEYHPFTPPASTLQPGLANWGITYGKIQTPAGPAHVFCASHANAQSGMTSGAAETLNAEQSQEVLDYIQSKANGEIAIYLASTGSGPAVVSSPTGPANAQWPDNFAILQGGLTDALLANLDGSANPLAAEACTYGCSDSSASYVDHVMTSGQVGHRQGGLLFTSAIVATGGAPIPLSEHAGVRSEICADRNLQRTLPGAMMRLMDPGDPARRSMVFRMSDPSIDLTGLDPRVTGATAYIGPPGGGSPLTLEMPASGWKKANGAEEYRFRSRTGPVTSARLRAGSMIRIGAKGIGSYALGSAQGSVGVVVEVGDARFCSTFGGKVMKDDDSLFLSIRAPQPANCPVL